MSMWDYLLRTANFRSPETFETTTSSNPVNDSERSRVGEDERPKYASCDNRMVDSLINKLEEYLETIPISLSQQAVLDKCFQPIVDKRGRHSHWQSNRNKPEVSLNNLSHAA